MKPAYECKEKLRIALFNEYQYQYQWNCLNIKKCTDDDQELLGSAQNCEAVLITTKNWTNVDKGSQPYHKRQNL